MLWVMGLISVVLLIAAPTMKGSGLVFFFATAGLAAAIQGVAIRLFFYFCAEVLDRMDSRT